MWRYRRPRFEALLLAELQRQQRCSQFCDTVLRAEGVSVPAHSSVLSAFSPQLSCALSCATPPPSGRSRLLDLKATKASTLLRLVGLLYSGEMTGEGEAERQEAISTAAMLGIHGLVEVVKRGEEPTPRREVGVQTETSQPGREQGGEGRRRREEKDGSTLPRNETPSSGARDGGTQTAETNAGLFPQLSATFQTADIQRPPDPKLLPHHTPYVPLSPLYMPDGVQAFARLPPPPSSTLLPPAEECSAVGHAPVLPQAYSSLAAPPSAPPAPRCSGAAAEAGEQFDQFQGNIPGFIDHFFNLDQEAAVAPPGRRRGRGRRGGEDTGGARRAGTGERRARRPRVRRGGGGGGRRGSPRRKKTAGVMEDVVVVVNTPLRDRRRRSGLQVSRRGVGGGVVGRRLFLKTRELLQKPIKIHLKRRGRGEAWEVLGGGGEKRGATGRLSSTQLTEVDAPGTQRQRNREREKKPDKTQTFEPPSNPPPPSPSSVPSPHPPYISPAPALLHTTLLPPVDNPLSREAEQFEQLLEDLMIDLDILPGAATLCPQDYPSSEETPVQPQQHQEGYQEVVRQGIPIVTAPVSAGTGSMATGVSRSPLEREVPVLQQQHGEGELSDILDHFLRTFEQHIATCSGEARPETGGRSHAEPDSRATATTGSQTQPCVERGAAVYASHPGPAGSPRAVHSIASSTRTQSPAVSTVPPPPPQPAVLPRLPGGTDQESVEREERGLTRRQRRERTGVPAQAARWTEQPEREKAHAEGPPGFTQPSKSSAPRATTLATRAHTTATTPYGQPKAASRVRSRPDRPLAKRGRLYSERKRVRVRTVRLGTDDAKTSERERGGKVPQLAAMCQARLETNGRPPPEAEESGPPGRHPPHSQQPIRTEPEFRGRTVEVKTIQKTKAEVKTSPPSVDCPIRSLSDCNPQNKLIIPWRSYPLRGRLSDHHIQSLPLADEELPSWNHPLPDHQPGSTLEEVLTYPPQPMRIRDLKEAIGDKLKRGRGRPRKERPSMAPSGGESLKAKAATTLTQRTERHCTEEQDGPGEERNGEKRVLLEGEAGEPTRMGEKRRIETETEKERRTDGVKRVCLKQVGLKLDISKPHTSSSEPEPCVLGPWSGSQDASSEESGKEEEDVVVTSDSVDEVEERGRGEAERGRGEAERGRGRDPRQEEKRRETDEDTEGLVSSDEDVDVTGGDTDTSVDMVGDNHDAMEWVEKAQHRTHLLSLSAKEWKTPAPLRSAVQKPPVSQASRLTREVKLGSTGSWDEDEDEEVDVIGGFNPSFVPLPYNWGEWLKDVEEEEEKEEEVDVVGLMG